MKIYRKGDVIMDNKKVIQDVKKTDAVVSAKPVVKETIKPVAKKEEKKAADSVKKVAAPKTKKVEKPVAAKTVKPVEKKETKPAEKTTKKVLTKTKKKKEDRITEVYVQHKNEEILTKDIVHQIEEGFIAEGHRTSTIKTLQVYLNIHEKKAYYVINGKAEGKFVSF